jgi:hypothetical protein
MLRQEQRRNAGTDQILRDGAKAIPQVGSQGHLFRVGAERFPDALLDLLRLPPDGAQVFDLLVNLSLKAPVYRVWYLEHSPAHRRDAVRLRDVLGPVKFHPRCLRERKISLCTDVGFSSSASLGGLQIEGALKCLLEF